jgi:hypothetical protein
MGLLRSIRIYANRCPYCGKRMRLYSWKTAPFQLPALTNARVCVGKHYMRTEHVATAKIAEFEAGGSPIPQLADVVEFPNPLEEEKAIHQNLNIPLRKAPAPAKPAAPAPSASAAAAPGKPAEGAAD